ADVDEAVRMCQLMLGAGVFPLHLVERGPDGAATGLVSLLEPHVELADADRLRGELIEGIIGESEDETLMDRYLGGEELAVAELVKTTTDPYVGRVSLVRVFSGTLRPDIPVHVSGHGMTDRGHPDHDVDERIGALSSPLGATLRAVAACPAGDICAVARLTAAETGDTLSTPEEPRLVPPWDLPSPQLPVAVEAASRTDEDRLAAALARLVAEDPTVRLERRPDTGQLLLWCVGDAHAE